MFRSGLAEVIKYGVIDSPELLDDLEAAAARDGLREPAFLERIIATACRIKKELVELDERDRGLRRILNFGHTVGHAVEAASGYALSHGESVAIGMVAAARLSEQLHHLPADDRRRIASVIRAVGLPDRIPAETWIWKRSAPGSPGTRRRRGRPSTSSCSRNWGSPS